MIAIATFIGLRWDLMDLTMSNAATLVILWFRSLFILYSGSYSWDFYIEKSRSHIFALLPDIDFQHGNSLAMVLCH